MNKEYKPLYKNDVRLNSPQGVNRLLSRVANALIQDEIPESRARAITYVCTVILRSQELGELEERLIELEEAIKDEQ